MQALFSVIVVCYNNSQYLYDCIDSILKQDYDNIELVIADDYSKVFDIEGIKTYINSNAFDNIKHFDIYQNECNLGTVKNINRAIKKCSGTYLKVIAADDALYDGLVLSKAAEALDSSPCGLIVADVMKCDRNLAEIELYSKKLYNRINIMSAQECFKALCIHDDIVAGGVFMKLSVVKKHGLFDENYVLMEDWPMWLRICKAGDRFKYISFLCLKYRMDVGIGTSVNPVYMSDKRRLLKEIIIPSKKELGFLIYMKSRLYFALVNSIIVRKLYSLIFRRK